MPNPTLRRGALRSLRLLCAALALLCAVPVSAIAQYGSTFHDTPTLTQNDINIVRKLVRQDLTGKPNGTVLDWNNPETTNSGTVTLLRTFPSNGRDCRSVRYFIKPGSKGPSGTRPATYDLTSCRTAAGAWQIDNSAQPDKQTR
jgi:surface antigen